MTYYTSTFKYPKTKKLKNENIDINTNNMNFCSSTIIIMIIVKNMQNS